MFRKREWATLGLITLAQVGLVCCYLGWQGKLFQPSMTSGLVDLENAQIVVPPAGNQTDTMPEPPLETEPPPMPELGGEDALPPVKPLSPPQTAPEKSEPLLPAMFNADTAQEKKKLLPVPDPVLPPAMADKGPPIPAPTPMIPPAPKPGLDIPPPGVGVPKHLIHEKPAPVIPPVGNSNPTTPGVIPAKDNKKTEVAPSGPPFVKPMPDVPLLPGVATPIKNEPGVVPPQPPEAKYVAGIGPLEKGPVPPVGPPAPTDKINPPTVATPPAPIPPGPPADPKANPQSGTKPVLPDLPGPVTPTELGSAAVTKLNSGTAKPFTATMVMSGLAKSGMPAITPAVCKDQFEKPSPWKFQVAIVDQRTVLTAKTAKGATFVIRCEKLNLNRPGGNVEATGNVEIDGKEMKGSCDRLTITWGEDRLLLEGNATLKRWTGGELIELHGPQLHFHMSTVGPNGNAYQPGDDGTGTIRPASFSF
jgi:hypothetical protein